MRFAEMTQEVEVARPQQVRFDVGLTPGRRRRNKEFHDALAEVDPLNGEWQEGRPVLYAGIFIFFEARKASPSIWNNRHYIITMLYLFSSHNFFSEGGDSTKRERKSLKNLWYWMSYRLEAAL